MLSITKIHQFFSPSQDFPLSSLSSSDKNKIKHIQGESAGDGSFLTWKPDLVFPLIQTLKANRSYWIASKTQGFAAYALPIEDGGFHDQNNLITKQMQFFTYRSQSSFQIGNLIPEIKSRILRIYKVNAAGSLILAWEPNLQINPFLFFSYQSTFIIQSKSQGFVPYNLGAPAPVNSSSSSEGLVVSSEFVNDSLLPDIGLIPYE